MVVVVVEIKMRRRRRTTAIEAAGGRRTGDTIPSQQDLQVQISVSGRLSLEDYYVFLVRVVCCRVVSWA